MFVGGGEDGKYAVLLAQRQEKIDEGVVLVEWMRVWRVTPTLLAVPSNLEGVRKPLSLPVGDKDGMFDMGSVGKIQDLLAGKTEVPLELRMSLQLISFFFARCKMVVDGVLF